MNQRTDKQRTADAKIARLRARIKDAGWKMEASVRVILLGILDLLDDEL